MRFPAGEHFNRLTSLQVDDDRSVLVTARDRPIIDADDPRSWFALALRYSAQFPQLGVGTGAQAQGVGKPGRSLTTEGVAQRATPEPAITYDVDTDRPRCGCSRQTYDGGSWRSYT
ncbi:hypothetical protein AWV80_05995 [Cupriavidus sp. UYMU48A]|nr:hypothetical protein AWV80_05995 [Cupriavidus sp. UYMU48A]